MKSICIVLCLFAMGTIAVDQAPMATFVCALCSAGSPLSQTFLPEGQTCTDLDIAMKNLGKPGCFGLEGSLSSIIDITNATQLYEETQRLEAALAAEQLKNRNLLIAVICLGVGVGVVIVAAFVVVWCLWKRDMDSINITDGQYQSQARVERSNHELKFL